MELPLASELQSCQVSESRAVREYLTAQRVTIGSAIRQASESREGSVVLDLTNTFPKIGSVKTSDVQLICLRHLIEELETRGYKVFACFVSGTPTVHLEISWQAAGSKEASDALEFIKSRLKTARA